MNILVIGDSSSTNLGDPILTNCTKYLTDTVCAQKNIPCKTTIFDIVGRKSVSHNANTNLSPTPKKASTMLNNKLIVDIKILIKWFLKDKKTFTKRLYSAISNNQKWLFVIAGGAFISDSLLYGLRLNLISRIAEKENIKIIFNSVGLEKTVFNSLNYPVIRNMLKSKAITYFSTRDCVDMIPKITNRKNFFVQTADSGLFACEAYGIKKNEDNVVGIGVISLEAYHSVKKNEPRAKKVSEESLMQFWHNIINQLEKQNIKWKVFTNGGPKDYLLAQKLMQRYNLPKENLLPLPNTPNDLLESISKFKAVIAHRLHSLIISTSFEIPVVPVQWSGKIQNFADLIDMSEYILWPEAKNGLKAAQFVQNEDFSFKEHTVSLAKQKSAEYLENAIIQTIEKYY